MTREKNHLRPLLQRSPLPHPRNCECCGVVAAEVTAFCSNVRNTIMDTVKKANRHIASRAWHVRHCVPGFAKHALAWLPRNGFVAVPSDKDGTFVLASKETVELMTSAELVRPTYRAVPDFVVKRDFEFCRQAAYRISKSLAAAGFNSWSCEVDSIASKAKLTGFASKINVTIKTHKPPGLVKCRVLHACRCDLVRALGTIAHRWMCEKLSTLPMVVSSSEQLVARLNTTTFNSDNIMLCKLDVDHFYLSGQHRDLVNAAISWFNGPQKDLLEQILYTVLAYQFVESPSGDFFSVDLGTGMGAVHSGALADLAFYAVVEQALSKEALGIHLYARFRDDVLVVVEGGETEANKVVGRMKALASPSWSLSLDSMSCHAACMLDLWVFVGPRFRSSLCLDFAPYVKPTAVHVPLSSSSGHPWHVHMAWPQAEIRRIRKRSLRDNSFEFYKARKLTRWAKFFMHPAILRAASDTEVSAPPPGLPKAGLCLSPLRLVVRYHPALVGLSKALSLICGKWGLILRHVVRPGSRLHSPVIQVVNSSGGRPLFSRVR